MYKIYLAAMGHSVNTNMNSYGSYTDELAVEKVFERHAENSIEAWTVKVFQNEKIGLLRIGNQLFALDVIRRKLEKLF